VVGRRIAVVGTTGSGKTRLACQISARLTIPRIELDALHWEPNWKQAPTDVFRERVNVALHGDAWVIDGNYSQARDIIWSRAQSIVWLDYPLPLVLARLIRRSIRRIVTRELLWNGNREDWGALFGRESLILWAISSRPKQRRDYPLLMKRPEYSHLSLTRLRLPRETDEWLARLDCVTI
jgi:adenylate kinase family enzyme